MDLRQQTIGLTANADQQYVAENDLPKPLSGPGAQRQTRRLQLRNQRFRAAAVPTRKVTPKCMTSSEWSAASGMQQSSDAENVSPSGQRALSVNRRRTSGILQEVGNASVTRPKKARHRMSSAKVFENREAGEYDGMFGEAPMSPPPPKSITMPRAAKTRAMTVQKRRSVSAEASKYIEHLEAELASAQTQLSSITSPSVTREQSSKMRAINSETKQLQDELVDWERKYEERVQEEIDRHCEIETSLRSQIRTLEEDAGEIKLRVQELEDQLEVAIQSVEAAEAANINLEKRLELMSELLATSPTKIDLHAGAVGIRRRHMRPKSMLPRFPTASSLGFSPERQPQTQPTSPTQPFRNVRAAASHWPGHQASIQPKLRLDTSISNSDIASEVESVFSDAPITADSLTTADHSMSLNSWTLQARETAKARPARRMRRFGAGSVRPKSLILPSTSYYGHIPSSAPPLQRHEAAPCFTFPDIESMQEENASPSSFVSSRRRALTVDHATSFARLTTTPPSVQPLPVDEGSVEADESMATVAYPLSAESQLSSRDVSSLGQATGRNLMDELTAVRVSDSYETTDFSVVAEIAGQSGMLSIHPTTPSRQMTNGNYTTMPEDYGPWSDALIELSPSVAANHQRRHSRSNSVLGTCNTSAWQRFHALFSDLWHSPLALTRHLVQLAQSRMRLPAPLRDVQWWLVGILLGPMAKRRMLARSACWEERPLLQIHTSPKSEQTEPIAYGTFHRSSPTSPARGSTVAGSGKKRVVKNKQRCVHLRAKHSPWMWLKFSITLAFAVGVAFKDGPASLLRASACVCSRRRRASAAEDSRNSSATLC